MAVLHIGDILTIAFYFVVVIGFGIWSSFKNQNNVDSFFIARRSIHFIPVGASLFSSNIGTSLFIGLAGSAANSGIAVSGFELNALLVLILLGWVFIPVYIRISTTSTLKVFTLPEYIKKRFGGERIRILLSVLSLLLNIFIRITADLFGGALFIRTYLNWDLYSSIIFLIVISAFFTVGGGASAVIWTDFIQTIFMIGGALYLMIISFIKVGGISGIMDQFSYAISSSVVFSNTTCGVPGSDYFNIYRAIDTDFPWFGMNFGLTVSAVWYWCSDQMIVQRALAAKNLTHTKAGCIFAGYLKLTPVFLIILTGMISRIYYSEELGCIEPEVCKKLCNSEAGCSNIAYPLLIINMMPPGARGLMVAVMIAALMSSLSSVFNSCSVIFTMDLWKRFRKNAKDVELIIVGRVFVVGFVIISIVWIPVIELSQGSRLFDYIQSITSFLAPPVCAIYVQAILFKRINETGAFWGLVIGLAVGMVRFIWQFSYQEPPCLKSYLDNRPAIISKVHFLHFGVILFVITCIVTWTISLLTKPIPDKYIRRLTYFTIDDAEEPVPIDEMYSTTEKKEPKARCFKFKVTNSRQQQKTQEATEVEVKPAGKFKKAFFWVCGIKKAETQAYKIDTSIDQDPFWKTVCDVNAVVAMALCGFIYTFFNKYTD